MSCQKDELGIEAIIFLQGLAGIHETRAKARKGWAAMSPSEREQTLLAYKALHGGLG